MSRAGLLKDRLQFFEQTETKNEFLEDELVWNLAFTARGNLKHSGGSKTELHEERFQGVQKDFIMRDQWPIDSSMRVKYNNQDYEITDIQPTKYQSKFITVKLNRIND